MQVSLFSFLLSLSWFLLLCRLSPFLSASLEIKTSTLSNENWRYLRVESATKFSKTQLLVWNFSMTTSNLLIWINASKCHICVDGQLVEDSAVSIENNLLQQSFAHMCPLVCWSAGATIQQISPVWSNKSNWPVFGECRRQPIRI